MNALNPSKLTEKGKCAVYVRIANIASRARVAPIAMAATRSLYRRALRVASLCVDEHRDWMASYVKLRFRDDALARGGGAAAVERRLNEAEEELQRMVHTLERAGRLQGPEAASMAARSVQSPQSPAIEPTPQGGQGLQHKAVSPPYYEWDENAVGAWLQEIGLGHLAPSFAQCRVDGRLLLRLDEDDLAEDLGVTKRFERKRVLTQIEKLRAEMG